jgi:S1-C subfamily serine protease
MSSAKKSVGWSGAAVAALFFAYGVFRGVKNLTPGVERAAASASAPPSARPPFTVQTFTIPAHPSTAPTAVTGPSGPLGSTELFRVTSPSVVRIVAIDAHNQPSKFGSGFYVSGDGLIATNFHVIQGAKSLKVVTQESATLWVSRTVASDPERDLALLKVDGGDRPALKLAGAVPAIGARVYAIGNPIGLTNTLSEGIVSGVRAMEGQTWIQTTAAISPGSSGGPLIDEEGRVVGVSTMAIRGGQNLNFAVDAASVQRLIEYPQGASSSSISTTQPSLSQLASNLAVSELLDEAFRETARLKYGQGRAYKRLAELAGRAGRMDLCRQAALRARATMDQRDLSEMFHEGDFEAALVQILIRAREWDAAAQVAQGMTDAGKRAGELLLVRGAAREAGESEVADRLRVLAREAREKQIAAIPASSKESSEALRAVRDAIDDGDFRRAVAAARELKDTGDPHANRELEGPAKRALNLRSRALLLCLSDDLVKEDVSVRTPIVQEIFDQADRDRALLRLIVLLEQKDQLEAATSLAARLSLPEFVAHAYCLLARAQLKQGVSPQFKVSLRTALEASGKVSNTLLSSVVFSELAGCLMEAGAVHDAGVMAHKIPDPLLRDAMLRMVAVRHVKNGNAEAALGMARTSFSQQFRDMTYQQIAKEQAAMGDYDAAVRTAKLITLAAWRPVAMRDIAIAQANAGRYADVQFTLYNTPTMAVVDRDRVYQSLAQTQAKAGLIKLALDSASAIRTPSLRGAAMAAIVDGCFSLQTTGEWLAWMDQYSKPEERAWPLMALTDRLLNAAAPAQTATTQPTTRPLPQTRS